MSRIFSLPWANILNKPSIGDLAGVLPLDKLPAHTHSWNDLSGLLPLDKLPAHTHDDRYARLSGENTLTGNQAVTGNITASGTLGVGGAASSLEYRADVAMLGFNGQLYNSTGVAIGSAGFRPGLNLGQNAKITWTNDTPASTPQASLERSGTVIIAKGDGGVYVRNLAGSADGPLYASSAVFSAQYPISLRGFAYVSSQANNEVTLHNSAVSGFAKLNAGAAAFNGTVNFVPTAGSSPSSGVNVYSGASADLYFRSTFSQCYLQMGGGGSTLASALWMTVSGSGGVYIGRNPQADNTRTFLKVVDANNLSLRNAADSADISLTAAQLTLNRPTAASYGVYACGKNANGYVDWELNEGLIAGTYGGSLTLRAGDAANTGFFRFRYDLGYPKIATNQSGINLSCSNNSVQLANTYFQVSQGANIVFSVDNQNTMSTITRTDNGLDVLNLAGTAKAKIQARAGGTRFVNGLQGTHGVEFSEIHSDGRTSLRHSANTGNNIEFYHAGPGNLNYWSLNTCSIMATTKWGTGPSGNSNNLVLYQSSASGADATIGIYAERYADATVNGQPKLAFYGKRISLNTKSADTYLLSGVVEQAYIDTNGLTVNNNISASGYVSSAFRSLSANPTTLDIAAGREQLVKNTTNGELRRWAHDSGSMKSILYA